MTSKRNALKSSLQKITGRHLEFVNGLVFFCEGKFTGDPPNELWLEFEGGLQMRIIGCGDGETLDVDSALMRPNNMCDDGELLVRDLSQMVVWRGVLKKRLESSAMIFQCDSESPTGMRLDFEDHQPVIILHWGDELYVDTDYPDDPNDPIDRGWREVELG